MKGSTLALLLGGGLAVGGAVYYLRKKAAEPDKCANLSALDARAGALCRLGVIDAAGEVAAGVTHFTNSTIGKVLGKISSVISSSIMGNCDNNCKRRRCEQIRDTGKLGPFGGVTLNDAAKAKYRPGCAEVGIHF